MVIFVDFNERNIMLENTETEIEDVSRQTTEVLLEVGCKYICNWILNKLETDVMIEHYQYYVFFNFNINLFWGVNQNLLIFGLGDVFVIYYRDENSKFLPHENLYNTSLFSIDNHTILSSLGSRGRLFSVYDSFHPQQVQLLKNCLK